jgi:hypothetical protein
MKEFTLERNPMDVSCVAKPSLTTIPFAIMKWFTLGRNHMSANYVGEPFLV